MKFNKSGISVFIALYLAASMSLAPALQAQTTQVVPRDAEMKLVLNQQLSTKDTEEGQKFTATVAEDVLANGRVLIRHGATVHGTVTEVERPKRLAGLAGKAKMMLRFDTVQTINGERPLQATIISVHDPAKVTADKDEDKNTKTGDEGQVESKSDIKDILTKGAIGVAAGAVLGAIFGNVSKGVLLGTIGGAVAILAPKGKDVTLQEGMGLRVRLERDLNVSVT
jgi:hypothetical protein